MRRIYAVFIIMALIWMMPCGFHSIKAAMPDGYTMVAQSSKLALYYNADKANILVEDRRNGFVWSSSVTQEEYYKEGLSELWKGNMNSLVTLAYTSLLRQINQFTGEVTWKTTDQIAFTNPVAMKAETLVNPIDSGIGIEYNFPTIKIGFKLEIRLNDDALDVKIPKDSISEGEQFKIVSIEIMPFLGAADDYRDGYIFYPDGPGALFDFTPNHPETTVGYKWSVFGSDDPEDYVHTSNRPGDIRNVDQILMPVFGLKRDSNAFIAIVEDGRGDTSINFYPSGYIVNLNRISAEFTYRRFYKSRSPKAGTLEFAEFSVVEEDMLSEDHSMKYVFLNDQQANYSGMANAYRQYLIKNGDIKQSIKPGDSIPLGLDILTGIKEDRLLFDRFIAMTRFDEVETIIDNFLSKGVDQIQLNLIGWTKSGFLTYPQHLPPNKSLGGSAGLKKLAGYAEDKGVKLFLQDNFVDAWRQNGGFSSRNDTMHSKNGLVLSNMTEDRFLLNPIVSWNRFVNDFLPNVKDLGVGGLTFERFGSAIYFDYHPQYPVSRGQTIGYWQKFMLRTNEDLGALAVKGGNAYVLKYADRLMDVPIEDAGYAFTSEVIPFYQMVVHGLIPYSAEEPINLFYDPIRQRLKMVEYGYMPYYQLTYRPSNLLKDTPYNQLFTSYYNEWFDAAVDAYNEFNERLGDTWSSFMTKHESLGDGIYKVAYDNGAIVYVNYNERPVRIEGHSIKALDYLVVDEWGNEK